MKIERGQWKSAPQAILCGIIVSVFLFGSAILAGGRLAPQVATKTVTIAVPSDDELYIDKVRVDRRQMAAEIETRLRNVAPEERTVYIKVARDVCYAVVVRLVDDLRAIGIEQIGFVADKERSEERRQSQDGRHVPPDRGGSARNAESSVDDETEVVVVALHRRHGGIAATVDGARTDRVGMESAMRRQMAARHVQTVIIVAPGDVDYGTVVAYIDAAKRAGAEVIGLRSDEFAIPGGTPNWRLPAPRT
jgi:biopolymer transport protein ExbD